MTENDNDPLLNLLKQTRDASMAAYEIAKPLRRLPEAVQGFSTRLQAVEVAVSAGSTANDFTAAMVEANRLLDRCEGVVNRSLKEATIATIIGLLFVGTCGFGIGWLLFRPAEPLTRAACDQAGGHISIGKGDVRPACWFWFEKE